MSKKPILAMGLQFYLTAFYEMDGDRTFGQTIGPIPRNVIARYADEYNLGSEAKEKLIYTIRRMDDDFLNRMHKKNS